MAELGYVYNRHAAFMRSSRSMTIGLVATDVTNPYFAELAMSVSDALRDSDYTVFTVYTGDELARQRQMITALVERQVDGIILLPAVGSTLSELGAVVGTTPIVQLARHFTDALDYAGPDNVSAARALSEHIASLAPSHVVMVGGPEHSSARAERLEGLTTGFEGTGVHFDPSEAVPTSNNPDDGARGISALLDHGVLPDVVVAYSDAVALGMYTELRRRNLTPGRDAAIASFDDVPFAALQAPPLTSVATRPADVGLAAAELILDRISEPGRDPRRIVVPSLLKVRASTVLWRPRG